MDNESNRELDRPSDEADQTAGGDGSKKAAEGAEPRSEQADGATLAMPQWQTTERPRLPSIDDYDWEQQIERIARRLSPHRVAAEETGEHETQNEDAEEQFLGAAAVHPPILRRAKNGVAAHAPQTQEPVRRRPVGKVLAVVVPALAIAAALPFAYGVPGASTEAGDWPAADSERQLTGVTFKPAPHANPAVLRRDREARPASARPSRTSEAAAAVLFPARAMVPSADPAEALALAAAQERRGRDAREATAIEASSVEAPPEPGRVRPAPAEALPEPSARSAPAPTGHRVAEARQGGSALPKSDAAASPHSPGSAEPEEESGQQPPLRSLSVREIEDLLARGQQLLETGDIASARLLFQLVAEAGDPRGAKAMGMTYDPSVFAELPVAGMEHDRAQAEIWYDRSDAMPALAESAQDGDADAPVRPVDHADQRHGRAASR